MNNTTVGILMLVSSVATIGANLPDEMLHVYDQSVAQAQLASTAGDMHSMSVMLDATYVMDRSLPSEQEFNTWLENSFKGNPAKDLAEDHWGNRYIYTVSENRRTYQLLSMGPDGTAGTGDDITRTGP